MKKVTVYNDNGQKVEDIALNKDIFGIDPNEALVAMALRYQRNNSRKSIAHTKGKAEVRGGGKKPFRQKGTGRARRGSSRSPICIGGGVTFGPRNTRNFAIAMPRKQRRKALFSVLSKKLDGEQVFVLDKYGKKDIKTKQFAELHNKLPVEKSVLIVVGENSDVLTKSARNVEGVGIVDVRYLNIFDTLKYQSICFLKDSLPVLESTFLKS